MGEGNDKDTKNKEFTPTDDITIEFVEHDEVHNVNEVPEKIIEEKSQKEDNPCPEIDEKLKNTEERMLRLRADFENYRKRILKEWNEKEKRSQMEILRQILPFLDNIERAFATVSGNVDPNWLEGIQLSLKDFKSALEQLGLKEINECGILFDPNFHESIGFDCVDGYEDGTVAKIVQKGYLFKDGLLRPAKVFINKKEL